MPELQDFQKRMPSVDRRIADIKQDDIRVAFIGTVLDSQDNRIIVDDGSGKVSISFEQPVKTEASKLVRVMGRVIPMDTDVEIQGDVLQDMTGMDMELKKMAEDV